MKKLYGKLIICIIKDVVIKSLPKLSTLAMRQVGKAGGGGMCVCVNARFRCCNTFSFELV